MLLPEGEEHEQLAAHREIPKQQKASWPNSLEHLRHMADGARGAGDVARRCRWRVVGIPLLRLALDGQRIEVPRRPVMFKVHKGLRHGATQTHTSDRYKELETFILSSSQRIPAHLGRAQGALRDKQLAIPETARGFHLALMGRYQMA
jgi:hypothetical protein